jgi:hypothetical protein
MDIKDCVLFVLSIECFIRYIVKLDIVQMKLIDLYVYFNPVIINDDNELDDSLKKKYDDL